MLDRVHELRAELTRPGTPFEMQAAEIAGRDIRVWKNAPVSLRAVLEKTAEYGDREYLIYGPERLSYQDHYESVANLAHCLRDRFEVRKGDRIALAMRNLPEFVISFWAAAAIGAVIVPLNAWWTGDELSYGLSDSGAKVAILDQERLERVAPYLADLSLAGVIGARIQNHCNIDILTFDTLPSRAPGLGLPDVDVAPEDSATIFYTSGTTGRPKGALGTHRNICSTIWSTAFGVVLGRALKALPPPPPSETKTILVTLPMFHVIGCHSTLAVQTFAGNKLILMHKWDAEDALNLIEDEAVNVVGGVPAMMWQLVESPSLENRNVTSVERISYGGAPAAPELIARLSARFPAVAPGTGYGMTETSSPSTTISAELFQEWPDSVGLPLPVCDMQVVGEDGTVLAAGERGELWIRGPNIVSGYWGKAEATAETFVEGWVRTGDIGRIDENGLVFVLDRAKDMLIRGGENVYCVEVENTLFSHPDIMEAAVIGLPHRVLGEEVGAVVRLRPGAAPTEQELKDHVAAHLAKFKVPVRIDMRHDDLPRNATGKVLKNVLRAELTS